MIKDDCNKCNNFSLYPYSTTCLECGGSPKNRKPLTNADKLRSMSDEELAEWIETIADCRMCKIDEGHCSGGGLNSRASCMIKWLDWLQQEVNDDP